MAGLPAKRRCHSRSLMTTTGAAPTRASLASIVRPRAAVAPSTSKKTPVTDAPGTCSAGACGPLIASASALYAAKLDSVRCWAAQSTTSDGDESAPRPGRSRLVVAMATSWSGAGNGSGRRMTARTALNTAAVAPTPTPRVRTARARNAG